MNRRAAAIGTRTRAGLLIVALALVFGQSKAWAWGDRTHPAIVRLAIDTLPPDVAREFRRHSRKLERFSVEPDSVLRARYGREESIRHFLDLDGYMAAPFKDFPRYHEEAIAMIGKRKVRKYGVLPWTILRKDSELRAALRRDGEEWVRLAGYLAHYVGDAYQPLHLTVDFDGQKSGAKGIHKRLENDVVDARIRAYEKSIGKTLQPALLVRDARERIFQALFRSYAGAEVITRADHVARRAGRARTRAYNDRLEGEVGALCRRQISDAATMLGSLWLSAWHTSRP